MNTATKPHHVSGLAYVVTFAALLVLATVSLLLSFLHWPTGDLIVSLVIAAVKAILVLCFFMHLVEQPFSHALTIVVSVGFVTLLVGLAAADVASRRTFPARVRPVAAQVFYQR